MYNKEAGMSLEKLVKGTKLQECCMNYCRDFRETRGGFPVSNHSPACINYKTEAFFKITEKGKISPFLILENKDQIKYFLGENISAYDIVEIQLTRDQFDNLDEFDGF
jgi:hypothetical protein